jgi:hypothetical protein
MRKNLIAAALTCLALAGCGTAAAPSRPATSAPAAAGFSAAEAYLTADWTGVTSIAVTGGFVNSAAYGYNGNAEEMVIDYDTARGAADAFVYYNNQVDSAGITGQIIVSDRGTYVVIVGADSYMSQFVDQFGTKS